MMTRLGSSRRGLAALTAIMLIGLVGATLATVAVMFISQHKRTRAEAVETQIRQLLTAGAAMAVHQLDQPGGEHALALPAELAAEGAKLVIKTKPAGDSASVDFEGSLRGRRMMQTLRFERRDGKWKLTDAVLGGDQPPASAQPSDRSTAASQRS